MFLTEKSALRNARAFTYAVRLKFIDENAGRKSVALAGTRMGHNRRTQGTDARMEDRDVSRYKDSAPTPHRNGGESLERLIKNGRARYIAGYHPLFLLATCVLRLFSKPYVVRSAGLLWGYLQGYIKNIPRVDDPALIRFVRREQLKRLLGRQTVWNSRY